MPAPAQVPSRGLAAGCPRATDWLAIMSHVLVRELLQEVPQSLPRPYVDDLTADIEHADDDDGHEAATEAVAAMVTVVTRYAHSCQFEVNTTKSRRFSTSAPFLRCLSSIPCWVVATSFSFSHLRAPPT